MLSGRLASVGDVAVDVAVDEGMSGRRAGGWAGRRGGRAGRRGGQAGRQGGQAGRQAGRPRQPRCESSKTS